MKKFELVNGADLVTAREIVSQLNLKEGAPEESQVRNVRRQLVERVILPVAMRERRRAVHLSAVALDEVTINMGHARVPSGSEPIVLDLRSKSEDRYERLRPKQEVAKKKQEGLFDRIRK